jgi:hypothetical protein
MTFLRSALLLLAPSIATLLAVACSNSSSSGNGPPTEQDSGTTPDTGGAVDSATSPAPDSSTGTDEDAPSDTGSQSLPEAAPAPTCGPPPARYTILPDAGATAGLIEDNTTELIWMNDSAGGGEPPQTQTDAATYCSGRGMRLPTETEALGIANTNWAPCAFGQWST